jgi:DNA invertase Pin-like site-specific DNA recombinase
MNKDTGIKVYGYCRVSTSMQAEDGSSLANQETCIQEYCKKNNLELLQVFKESISGSVEPTQRPLLSHILREIDDTNADGIVVYKLDRLSRSIKDTVALLSTLSQKNKKFFEIKNNLSNHGAVNSFTMHLFSALAELERSMITERVNEVIKYRRNHNLLLGGIPFGKKLIEKDDEKVLIDDDEEQRTIAMIKELRNTIVIKKLKKGEKKVNMPFLDIAKVLTREKRKNKDGGVSWYPSNVKRIYLKNK